MEKGRAGSGPASSQRDPHSTVARGADTTDLSPGDLIELLGLSPDAVPGYALLRRIGGGAQGDVYLALQSAPRRKVAIKIQREVLGSELADAARFDREIDALARLRHPNIVAIHASGTAGDFRYYVMDYLSGVTLAEWLEKRSATGGSGSSGRGRAARPSIGPVITMFAKICRAVYAAHARGITHRDLKPTNIRVDADGEPHILDFGLAKMSAAAGDASTMTLSGVFIGSVPWASPEQAAGDNDRVDARSDVYSLGVLLYQALTGEFPYSIRGGGREVLDRVIHDAPIPPRQVRPDLDSDLETIVLQCLAKDRERRYADAGELAADLARYQGGEPIAARRDSVAYLLMSRAKLTLRQRPVEIHLGVQATVVAAVYLAIWALGSTTLDLNFRRAMISLSPQLATGIAPQRVRLVALRDPSSIRRMADSLQIAGITADSRPSHRALHGRLMKRLAECGVTGVLWDYSFSAKSDFDAEFVSGVRALQSLDPPAPVIAISPDENWVFGSSGLPQLCDAFAKSGVLVAPMLIERAGSWACQILFEPDERAVRPGAQLATVSAIAAAQQEPGIDVEYQFDRKKHAITVEYRQRAARDSSSGRVVRQRIDCSGVERAFDGWVASLQAEIPPPALLGPEILEYEDVISGNVSDLRALLAGRAVVVGDARPGVDLHNHLRYGAIPGCIAVAAGLDALLAQTAHMITPTAYSLALFAACLTVGFAVGRRFAHAHFQRGIALACLAAMCIFCSLLAYSAARFLLNPTAYVLACLLATEAAAWLERAQSSWQRMR